MRYRPLTIPLYAVLLLAAAGCGSSGNASPPPGSTYTLMQMNLCLSGLADCHGKRSYPAVVEDAVARIRSERPDAVTVSEVCQGDAARIARRTGYRMRFSIVIYRGRRLPCIRPGGRGLFGDAVLTAAGIAHTYGRPFASQAGIERRRWLCVTTTRAIVVCTAHLNTRSTVEGAGNDAQCAELTRLLARRATRHTVIFGGDVNRHESCAPEGMWTRTDSDAEQAAGLQHVYGSATLRSPSAEVLPARHTDHDVLVVRAEAPG